MPSMLGNTLTDFGHTTFFFALNEKQRQHEHKHTEFYFYSFRGHYTFIRFRVLNPKDNYFFPNLILNELNFRDLFFVPEI